MRLKTAAPDVVACFQKEYRQIPDPVRFKIRDFLRQGLTYPRRCERLPDQAGHLRISPETRCEGLII